MTTSTPPAWARTLRQLRTLRGWSQRDLAAELNCTAAAVSKWEQGTNMPSGEVILHMADLFGVSADLLVGRKTSDRKSEVLIVPEEGDADALIRHVSIELELPPGRGRDWAERMRHVLALWSRLSPGAESALAMVLTGLVETEETSPEPFEPVERLDSAPVLAPKSPAASPLSEERRQELRELRMRQRRPTRLIDRDADQPADLAPPPGSTRSRQATGRPPKPKA
ncbi:MAG: helix-turn-helix domain-containing protein [Sulfobacillus sp.]